MSTTTQPTTFSDLYADLMSRARVDANQTINTTNAKKLINTGLFDMHLGNGEVFPWAHRDARLLTQAPYSTGTVAAASGSASVTGTGTAWNTNNDFGVKNVRAGGKILFDGDETVYEVSAVGGDGALTLTDVYIGSTLTAGTYQYFEDEYALASDFLRPLDLTKFDSRGEIEILDRREFRRRFTRITTTGKPRVCTLFEKGFSGNTTPIRRVMFFRPPDAAQYLPYSYVTAYLAISSTGTYQQQLTSDSDEPIVPLYARHLIVLKALEHWYRDKKNDDRSAEVKAEYVDGMSRLFTDIPIGDRRPRIEPRSSGYVQRARNPYRYGSRSSGKRNTIGTAFDELLE